MGEDEFDKGWARMNPRSSCEQKNCFWSPSTNLYCHKSRLVVEDNARPFQVINKTSDFISQTTAMPSRITKRFFF